MKRVRTENINTSVWWSKNWEDTPAWKMGTDILFDRLETVAERIRPGDLVLDVGGGRGEIAAWLEARAGCFITVADHAPSAIAECKKRGITGFVCDYLNLANYFVPLFDVVFAGELLEHTECPAELIAQMAAVCKPGGWLIVTAPNEANYANDPTHMWEFEVADVEELLGKYGKPESKIVGTQMVVSCRKAVRCDG